MATNVLLLEDCVKKKDDCIVFVSVVSTKERKETYKT